MDVSLIIVNWNTCDILRDCLKSVFQQTKEIDFEVIVVDNASTDGSAEMVKKDFTQVILIENSENRGFAVANNQGIAIAKGCFVLLLNSDTVVFDNAIEKVVAFADSVPKAGIIGCRILDSNRALQPTCFMFPSILNMLLSTTYLYKLFPKSKFFGREQMTWWNRDDVREVDVVTGCFMLVRRDVAEEIGVMDERFFMYGEETDWCYRFRKNGWKVIFTPEAEIIHYGGQSSKQTAPQMALQLRGSILQFFKKHRPHFEYRLACFLVLTFFVVRIPAWFVKWVISKKSRAYCWLRMKIYVVGAWRLVTRGAQSLCVKSCEL